MKLDDVSEVLNKYFVSIFWSSIRRTVRSVCESTSMLRQFEIKKVTVLGISKTIKVDKFTGLTGCIPSYNERQLGQLGEGNCLGIDEDLFIFSSQR